MRIVSGRGLAEQQSHARSRRRYLLRHPGRAANPLREHPVHRQHARAGRTAVPRELHRVLEPGGVLRLGLPDLDRAIDAYRTGDRGYFSIPDDEIASVDGKFVVQMTWYGTNLMMFTFEVARELLARAGFRDVRRAEYRRTTSPFPDIVHLDNRPKESFFVEATT
jgi:predicted SAM-dependent methyltransferase